MTPCTFCQRLAVAVIVTALTALAQPAPAAAQEPAREMIPRDVAEALAGGGPFLDAGRDVRILVGRLPDDLVSLLPAEPGANVVGSLVRRHMTEAVLDLPGTPDDVLNRWEEALLARGWTRLQLRSSPSTGGFTAAPPGRSHQFCMGDSLGLTLRADRHGGDSRLRLFLPQGRSTYNVCRHQEATPRGQHRDQSPLPELTPPPSVRMRGAGGGGGGTEFDSRAVAETDLPVAELAGHYHRQLVSHGWEPVGQAASDDVVIYRYRVPDGDRDSPWLGLLSVARGHDGDERYLTLEARRSQPW
jgi:hypothetical protein